MDESLPADSHTQKDVKNLISDIFGDSDDDQPVEKQKNETTESKKKEDDDDDIFADSDDDDNNNDYFNQKKDEPKSDDDNLFDSDDDIATKKLNKKRKIKELRDKNRKKSSLSKKIKKKSRKNEETNTKTSKNDKNVDSGDEYDSGEEIVLTKEDHDFIDGDDEHADLVKEYEEDNQVFADERPDDFNPKKKKYSSGNNNSDRVSLNKKNLDPLTEALIDMKNPKAKVYTDGEKEAFCDKLQYKMKKAAELDDILFAQSKPAFNKLKILPLVKQAITMKQMQNTLLEKDILCSLRDWIEPRDNKTLPALSVRTAVYELLLQLPCQPEHLKRIGQADKPPIGVIIVALRKHKMETAANKRILKELMDKWSRPIFSKNADIRSIAGGGLAEDPEVQQALRMKYAEEEQRKKLQQQQQSGEVLTLQGATTGLNNDPHSRVRTPYNTGFLYTVQPQFKNLDRRDVREQALGEGRMKLFKKAMDRAGGKNATGLGRKLNPRAVDMSVSGKNVKN